MLFIPAIDIIEGRCVRLEQGDYGKEKRYDQDPVDQALLFQDQGAGYIHVIDLDAAKGAGRENRQVIKKIAKSVNIPIEVGGGVRTRGDVVSYLGTGLARVILGTAAAEEKEGFEALAKEFPGKVSLAVDVKQGKVATWGWTSDSGADLADFLRSFDGLPLGEVICTAVARDGMLAGPDLETMKLAMDSTGHRLVASGGVSSADDVRALARMGAWGCIIGKALYEGRLTLAEACSAAETG